MPAGASEPTRDSDIPAPTADNLNWRTGGLQRTRDEDAKSKLPARPSPPHATGNARALHSDNAGRAVFITAHGGFSPRPELRSTIRAARTGEAGSIRGGRVKLGFGGSGGKLWGGAGKLGFLRLITTPRPGRSDRQIVLRSATICFFKDPSQLRMPVVVRQRPDAPFGGGAWRQTWFLVSSANRRTRATTDAVECALILGAQSARRPGRLGGRAADRAEKTKNHV